MFYSCGQYAESDPTVQSIFNQITSPRTSLRHQVGRRCRRGPACRALVLSNFVKFDPNLSNFVKPILAIFDKFDQNCQFLSNLVQICQILSNWVGFGAFAELCQNLSIFVKFDANLSNFVKNICQILSKIVKFCQMSCEIARSERGGCKRRTR